MDIANKGNEYEKRNGKIMTKSEKFIRVCAWCQKWWDSHSWTNRQLPKSDNLTHGCCPDCEERIYKEIKTTCKA